MLALLLLFYFFSVTLVLAVILNRLYIYVYMSVSLFRCHLCRLCDEERLVLCALCSRKYFLSTIYRFIVANSTISINSVYFLINRASDDVLINESAKA